MAFFFLFFFLACVTITYDLYFVYFYVHFFFCDDGVVYEHESQSLFIYRGVLSL